MLVTRIINNQKEEMEINPKFLKKFKKFGWIEAAKPQFDTFSTEQPEPEQTTEQAAEVKNKGGRPRKNLN